MIGRNLINNKLLALACILFVLLVLAACQDGGGSPTSINEPVEEICGITSILENGSCRTFAVRVDERAPTPFMQDGQPVSLEVVLNVSDNCVVF